MENCQQIPCSVDIRNKIFTSIEKQVKKLPTYCRNILETLIEKRNKTQNYFIQFHRMSPKVRGGKGVKFLR